MKDIMLYVNNTNEVIKMTTDSRERKEFLKKLKMEVATELGLLQNIKENNDHYRGDVPSRDNGALGGPVGGQMVKRMIQFAENNMQ